MADQRAINHATEALLDAISGLADEMDDEDEFPLGRVVAEIAEKMGVVDVRVDPDQTMRVGELRARTRKARADLASGELLP